jgi:hypothetical protein
VFLVVWVGFWYDHCYGLEKYVAVIIFDKVGAVVVRHFVIKIWVYGDLMLI